MFIPVATDEVQKVENSVLLFPNPCKDEMRISLKPDVWKQATVSVYSVTGQDLKTQIIEKESIISIIDLRPGVYFIRIKSGEKLWIRRVVKE